MKTAGVVENSGHCIYSIGLKCFKLSFAVSFSVLYINIYLYSISISVRQIKINCLQKAYVTPILASYKTSSDYMAYVNSIQTFPWL